MVAFVVIINFVDGWLSESTKSFFPILIQLTKIDLSFDGHAITYDD